MTAPAGTLPVRASPPKAGPPATFITFVGNNDIYWRVLTPAAALGAKVVRVPQERFVQTMSQPNARKDFPWSLTALFKDGTEKKIASKAAWDRLYQSRTPYIGLQAEFPLVEGVAVQTRPIPEQAVLARAMRRNGIRTIAEVDDNYFAAANLNLAMRQARMGEELRDGHARSIASHPENVYSTEWLRDRYYREFKHRFGKKNLPDMHVCHNNVPAHDWPERVERDGPLRVGFMGSTSHVWDLNHAYAAFHVAHQHGCDVTMIGHNPGQPDDLPDTVMADGETVEVRSERSKENIRKWRSIITTVVPWVNPGEYGRPALPLDIGLCPLRTDDFTLGKSDVKAIEYTISGAAVICSNMPVYNRHWKHEETCLMASSVDEMAMATDRLIKDHRLRFELVSNAQQYVQEERGLNQIRDEWTAVLDQ